LIGILTFADGKKHSHAILIFSEKESRMECGFYAGQCAFLEEKLRFFFQFTKNINKASQPRASSMNESEGVTFV
jgi:hypothetical protein